MRNKRLELIMPVPKNEINEPIKKLLYDTTPGKNRFIPGEYLLVFNDTSKDKNLENLKNLFASQNISTVEKKKNAVLFIKNVFPYLKIEHDKLKSIDRYMIVAQLDSVAIEAAKKDPKIKYVEKNYMITMPKSEPDPVQITNEQADWGVKSVCNLVYKNLNSTKRVWLLDSGVDPEHHDLNIDLALSRSEIPGSKFSDVEGEDYHGTHLAGIIGGRNNGKGIIGVAPNALIVAIKIMSKGSVQYSYYLKGLIDVLEEGSEGDILNLSIEGTQGSKSEVETIKAIGKKGIKVSMSAGNQTFNIHTYQIYPALIEGENLYSISAFNQSKQFSTFSNFGQPVKFCAPGESILSTLPGNRYGMSNGTSQAAAFACGILYLKGTINSAGSIQRNDDTNLYSEAHE